MGHKLSWVGKSGVKPKPLVYGELCPTEPGLRKYRFWFNLRGLTLWTMTCTVVWMDLCSFGHAQFERPGAHSCARKPVFLPNSLVFGDYFFKSIPVFGNTRWGVPRRKHNGLLQKNSRFKPTLRKILRCKGNITDWDLRYTKKGHFKLRELKKKNQGGGTHFLGAP